MSEEMKSQEVSRNSEDGRKTLIIGVGNDYRGDDAVGLFVARRLRKRLKGGVEIVERSGEGASLIEVWRGAHLVIVVDASQSGAKPGAIRRFDAHARKIPARHFKYSTHAFSIAQAVELSRALGELPPRTFVYGIEGENFSAGEGLSEVVEKSARKLEERILSDLRREFREK